MSLGGVRCKGSWLEVQGWIATAVISLPWSRWEEATRNSTNQTSLNHFDSPTPIVLIRYRRTMWSRRSWLAVIKRFFSFSVSPSSSCALGYRCAWWLRHTDIPTWIVYELEPVLQRVRCRWFSFNTWENIKIMNYLELMTVTRTANTQKLQITRINTVRAQYSLQSQTVLHWYFVI